MRLFVVMVVKVLGFILRKMGKGSAFPGQVALKLDKNMMTYFKFPKSVIFITGTTGKTSISGILTNIYSQNGYKVANNSKGSNMDTGVLSCLIANSDLFGRIKSDVLILEVDERYVKRVIKFIHPDYFIINNLSRDQLARNGHFDIVWHDINDQITDDIHLILNSNDPLVTKFGLNHKGKATYYGLEKTKYSEEKNNLNNLDIMYCPKCNKRLKFNYFHYSNLGDYECSSCDFKSPRPEFFARLIDDNTMEINGDEIKMSNSAIYNVYNLTVGYTTAIIDGLPKPGVIKALNNLSLDIKRLDTFEIDDKKCVLLLSKNETPISYNQSLDYISKQAGEKTVVIGFNNISGRYNLKDLSWLWDINFELLDSSSINKVVCVGNFSYDIATRLKYAGVEEKKIAIYEDSDQLLDALKTHGGDYIYCVFYFDMEKIFKRLLRGA